MRRIAIWVSVAGLLAATGAVGADYKVPRTADGAPDLQGVWGAPLSLTFLERPKALKSVVVPDAEAETYERDFNDASKQEADFKKARPNAPFVGAPDFEWAGGKFRLLRIKGQARGSILVDPADGQLPLLPATRARQRAERRQGWRNFDSADARPLDERCLVVAGPPIDAGPVQILQTHDHVVIDIEAAQGPRIIRLADQRHGPAAIRPWMGDSVGWWEGDTLVVETTRFNAAAERGGAPLSANAKVVERFSRTSPTEIIYRFTVEDPANYSRSWSGVAPLSALKGQVLPYECHEGNYALANILAGARRVERDGGVPEALDGGDPPPAVKSAQGPSDSPRPASPPAP